MIQDAVFVAHIAIKSSAAVLLAALGEVVSQRGGVLNLGLEGMMLAGALAAAALGAATHDPAIAVAGGMAAAGALALVHAFFAVTLRSNQVLSGLALTILGAGLTGFLGRPFIGKVGLRLGAWPIPGLSDIPLLGKVLFSHNPLVYAAYLLAPLCWWVLFHTRLGLTIRGVGEDAVAADAMGVPVALTRYGCVLFGGLLAGLGGAYLSLAYTPGWKESMTAGQGWIAIAMVIFATWSPVRVVAGALLFGGLTALQFLFQASGQELVPAWVLRALPYLLTIAVLVLVTRLEKRRGRTGAPAALGVPFAREH